MSWISGSADGTRTILTVRLVPRAARDEVVGTTGDALKIRLRAAPVEGRANEALTAFLADRIGIGRSRISIAAGHHSRNKRVAIEGVTVEEVRRVLFQ
ncbi:MAG: DUF167 domain-containing protein [Kiritimatiellae bacterium]|nr:DUF167 domain-containing protein [Kiritimatiellia bacterium]